MKFDQRKDVKGLGGVGEIFRRRFDALRAPETGTWGQFADTVYHLYFGSDMFACLVDLFRDAPFAAFSVEMNTFSLHLDGQFGVTIARDAALRAADSRSQITVRNSWSQP